MSEKNTVYDYENGIKKTYSDSDYEKVINGEMKDDLYSRHTDGTIGNKVEISPIENTSDESSSSNEESDDVPDIFGVIAKAYLVYKASRFVITKIRDRFSDHKEKKEIRKKIKNGKKVKVKFSDGTTRTLVYYRETKEYFNPDTEKKVLFKFTNSNSDTKSKTLTEEEVEQEFLKIFQGWLEMVNGRKKVQEGINALYNSDYFDSSYSKEEIEKLIIEELISSPELLEKLNSFLSQNPKYDIIFERKSRQNNEYIPITLNELNQMLEEDYAV